MRKSLLVLVLIGLFPSASLGQIELKNLSFRKTHDLTWDVSWKVDVINRGDRAVRVWLDFQFIDKDDFAVASDNGEILVAAGDSITYREVRFFHPAEYGRIASVNASAALRRSPLAANEIVVDSLLNEILPVSTFLKLSRDVETIAAAGNPMQKLEAAAKLSDIRVQLAVIGFTLSMQGIQTTKVDSVSALIRTLSRKLN